MLKLTIKLILFSVIFLLVKFISESVTETCYIFHGSLGSLCSFTLSILLYVALLMSMNFAWKIRPALSPLAGLIPFPQFIIELINMKVTGISSQRYPEILDLFYYYLFQYSLPCIIVAVVIAYATNKNVFNRP